MQGRSYNYIANDKHCVISKKEVFLLMSNNENKTRLIMVSGKNLHGNKSPLFIVVWQIRIMKKKT